MFAPTHLDSDSKDYHVLYEAALDTAKIPGLTLEIGVRRGGGTETIIQGTLVGGGRKTHVCVDPYGNIPYKEGEAVKHLDYTNEMKRQALPNIYKFAEEKGVDIIFFPFTDFAFFQIYNRLGGIPVYEGSERFESYFSLVHFDGPHEPQHVLDEASFFMNKCPLGAAFVFDDVHIYNHSIVDCQLKARGFELVQATERKIWYRKTRHHAPPI